VARNAFATSSAVAASHVSLFPHAARRALWTGCGQPLEIGFNSLIRRGFAIIAKKIGSDTRPQAQNRRVAPAIHPADRVEGNGPEQAANATPFRHLRRITLFYPEILWITL